MPTLHPRSSARIDCSAAHSPPLAELPAAWRSRAIELRAWAAAEGAAAALEGAAVQLEAALRHADDELLTLTEAAAVSGYSADHLGRLVRDGTIRNAGRPNAPRIRRGDLPVKPSAQLASAAPPLYDPQTDARTLLSRRGER